MSDSMQTSPDDLILADFLRDLDQVGPTGIDLPCWIEKYPNLEKRFRGVLSMHVSLEDARQQETPAIPKQLGEFRILRQIAEGGMGAVYEAIQTSLHRRVAVKTIRDAKLSPEAEQRFLREQSILGTLHQTNIVPIHTAGVEQGLQYFAMHCIDGATLSHVVKRLENSDDLMRSGNTPSLGQIACDDRAERIAREQQPSGPNAWNRRSAADPQPYPRQNQFSQQYLRSVAAVMSNVATAIHHAHQSNILHRDIKPSNIMVDAQEQCWIIDFGLARYVQEELHQLPEQFGPSHLVDFQTHAQALGTPAYMAPEQFHGTTNVRSDVYGLGVTLYELLTLRRPFTGTSFEDYQRAIEQTEALRPSASTLGLPADLEAICLKAMHRNPSQRYASAVEFALDLRRYLNGEPVAARPAWILRRMWQWSMRNKGWASSILLTALGLLGGLLLLSFLFQIATAREQESRRNLLIQRTREIFVTTHHQGWSDTARDGLREAAAIQADDALRDQATMLLSGMDISLQREFRISADSLTFDKESNQLLMGGTRTVDASRLWGGGLDDPALISNIPAGPVAFNADHEPLQLITANEELILLNLRNRKEVKRITIPPLSAENDNLPQDNWRQISARISQSANTIAVVSQVDNSESHDAVYVWKDDARQPVIIKQTASAVVLSDDGTLLATASPTGTVSIWSTKDGTKLDSFLTGLESPSVLRFSPEVTASALADTHKPAIPPVLAVGGLGRVLCLALPDGTPISILRGYRDNVHAIAFSPDGVMLVMCGRVYASLWDVSSGRELLRFNDANTMTDIAFSSQGDRIAVSHIAAHEDQQGVVRVWELESGRGMELLRGQTSPVAFAMLSPRGTFVAALSQDWKIAVWDRASRRLIRILSAPPGYFTDNAALRFSPDEKHLAFSSGMNACLWNVQSGRQTGIWKLPPGLEDEFAFQPSGDLHLLRMEVRSGTDSFLRGVNAQIDPRAIRLRKLVIGKQPLDVATDLTLNHHVYSIVTSGDGKNFVAEGLCLPPATWNRAIVAYDAATGERHWALPTKKEIPSARLTIDTTSSLLAIDLDGGDTAEILDLKSGRRVNYREPSPYCWHAKTDYSARPGSRGMGYEVYREGGESPLVTLAKAVEVSPLSPSFSTDGRLLVWGNMDGTVSVCDLEAAFTQLTSIGLSW